MVIGATLMLGGCLSTATPQSYLVAQLEQDRLGRLFGACVDVTDTHPGTSYLNKLEVHSSCSDFARATVP